MDYYQMICLKLRNDHALEVPPAEVKKNIAAFSGLKETDYRVKSAAKRLCRSEDYFLDFMEEMYFDRN